MNRNEEYRALLAVLENTPPELEDTVNRAQRREQVSRRKRRLFGIPAGSLAACFLAFMLLVNLFPPFAMACGSVPLLRELAKAVAWSPSLSAAVENAYVQPIEQEQTVNGVTARVEYIIVDQKQLNVYYTLDSKEYGQLEALFDLKLPDEERGSCSWGSSSFGTPNGELRTARADFIGREMPKSLKIALKVYPGSQDTDRPPEPMENSTHEMLKPADPWEPDYLAEFAFTLEFDPYFTAQGEQIQVDQTFLLDGQTLTVTDTEVYPTHMRLNILADEANTAWLKDLEFYLENEDGEQFIPATNGITASGDLESENTRSYWLDSTYFSHSEHLTLHITRANWLEKERETLYLNLKSGEHDPLPDGVELIQAVEYTEGWLLTFSAKSYEENHMYGVWGQSFEDAAGRKYSIDSFSGSITYYDEASGTYRESNGSVFYEEIPLRGFHGSEVWLKPNFTRVTEFAPSVTVPIV